MNVLRAIAMAFSCFSKIPMPQVEWRDENARYMMCFFPVVGMAIGLVLAAWVWLSRALGFGSVLFAAGLTLLPVIVTGGIHLDGFSDVIDAQSSHAEPQRKREILKDPHTGAFAGIFTAVYLVGYVAFASELQPVWETALLLGGMHAASRCMSSFATKVFPLSSSQGMLSFEHGKGVDWVPVGIVLALFVAVAAFMIWVSPLAGCVMLVVGLACLAGLYPFANSQFGGMSGDLAGFFLQVAELAMVAAYVITTKVVML